MKYELLKLYRTNREEFWRIFHYLLVGGWNTVFGVGLYTVLFELFSRKLGWRIEIDGQDYLYLILAVPVNVLAITNAYICYKVFVFKTRGNILREYFRCYIVYGTSMLLGMAGLWLLVGLCGLYPVIANILLTFVTVAVSYLGHKYFSFRRRND
jgi:putative flippase GtrA